MKPPVSGCLAISVALMALCSMAMVVDSPTWSVQEGGASQQSTKEHPRPPVLFTVSISPEARVKATQTEGSRELPHRTWVEFIIRIENAAGITAPLVVESEQLLLGDVDTARDHWLRLAIEPAGALTGAAREERVLRLWSRDVGIRTAILNINAGQGTQDLGFRSDVVISFRIKAATGLADQRSP